MNKYAYKHLTSVLYRTIFVSEDIFLTHEEKHMDYSESITYMRTFTRRCEDELNKSNLDKALEEAEHIVAEAIQLRATIMKMKEYA